MKMAKSVAFGMSVLQMNVVLQFLWLAISADTIVASVV
jgi:hypothetical protein